MMRTSESTTESDERRSTGRRGGLTASRTSDRAPLRDQGTTEIQRRVGNRTVQQLAGDDGRAVRPDVDANADSDLQRMCPRCRARASAGKPLDCPECEAELQRSETRADSGGSAPETGRASRKGGDPGLAVSDPDDRYEREADAAADAVMRMSAPGTRLAAGKSLNCPECEEELQRKADGSTAAGAGIAVADELAAARGRGRPLPGDVRAFFEPRFGRDFGDVRVHTGPRAQDLSESLGARAFTHGRDVFFASGEYRPSAREGRRLLAHELTHTIQQGAVDDTPGGDTTAADTRAEGTVQRSASTSLHPSGSGGSGTTGGSTGRSGGEKRDTGDGDSGESWGEWAWGGVESVGETASEAGEEATDWAGAGARSFLETLARALGGDVKFPDGKAILTVRDKQLPFPFGAHFDAPAYEKPIYERWKKSTIESLDVDSGTLLGSIKVDPAFEVQLPEPRLDLYRLEVNTNDFSATATIHLEVESQIGLEATTDASLLGSLSGALRLPHVPPVRIDSFVGQADVEGAGSFSGSGNHRIEHTTELSLRKLSIDLDTMARVGVVGGLSLGGSASFQAAGSPLCQLDVPGRSVEREIGVEAGLGVSLKTGVGGFDGDIELTTPRIVGDGLEVPSVDATEWITERNCRVCDLFEEMGWFAPRDVLAPYYMQSHDRLTEDEDGPVYPSRPATQLGDRAQFFSASGAECRGACGPGCWTCTYEAAPENAPYERKLVCPTHPACRRHDACFDYAAREGGETDGIISFAGPVHTICSLKCICDYSAGKCGNFVGNFASSAKSQMYFLGPTDSWPGKDQDSEDGEGGGGSDEEPPTASCPAPDDLAKGVPIEFTDRRRHRRGIVQRVGIGSDLGAPRRFENRWIVEYEHPVMDGSDGGEVGERGSTVMTRFHPAYGTDCRRNYEVADPTRDPFGACQATSMNLTVRMASVRSRPDVDAQVPTKKSREVYAYPLCPSEYGEKQNVLGEKRIDSSGDWERAHLLNARLGGPGELWNLAYVPEDTNKDMITPMEEHLQEWVPFMMRYGYYYWYRARVIYYDNEADQAIGHYDDFVKKIVARFGLAEVVGTGQWRLDPPYHGEPFIFSTAGKPDEEDVDPARIDG